MRSRVLARLVMLFGVPGLLAGCANTICGVGQNTANAVNATQAAGHKLERGPLRAGRPSAHAEARTLWRRFIYSLAVSTATAASRQ